MDRKVLLEEASVGTHKKSFYSGVEQCTFVPQLNNKSLSLAEKRRRQINKETPSTFDQEMENTAPRSGAVLPSDLGTRNASTSVPRKIRDFDPDAYKAEQERKELSECTFKPKINPYNPGKSNYCKSEPN